MDYKKNKCKYFLWSGVVSDFDFGKCINKNNEAINCTLTRSCSCKTYVAGSDTWGPANDKDIQRIEELNMLDGLLK